jgi:predicted nucleotidyltransferase
MSLVRVSGEGVYGEMAIDALIRRQRATILNVAAAYGARNVRIFGSRARGQARPDSDVDLLVTLDPGRSLIDIIGAKQDLEDQLHCRVDIVTESALSPYLRDAIMREAVAL